VIEQYRSEKLFFFCLSLYKGVGTRSKARKSRNGRGKADRIRSFRLYLWREEKKQKMATLYIWRGSVPTVENKGKKCSIKTPEVVVGQRLMGIGIR
jgi:hypothetical protein